MGRSRPWPLVLDAGALIAFDRRQRDIVVLLQRSRENDGDVVVPPVALGQAWRNGARQARLTSLLNESHVTIEDVTGDVARAAGELCARRGTSDVIDASVAVAARHNGDVVVTRDPVDFRQLDPSLLIEPV